MRNCIQEIATAHTPDSLAQRIQGEPGLVLLLSALLDSRQARYSFVAARPFLRFRSFGSRCELRSGDKRETQFGDPWRVLETLMSRYELLDQVDLPFPLGGCFGYWGYELKNFPEPKLPRRAANDLELPDCCVGFFDSLVVFDHHLAKTWIISTGVMPDGSRCEQRAGLQAEFWQDLLSGEVPGAITSPLAPPESARETTMPSVRRLRELPHQQVPGHRLPLLRPAGENRDDEAVSSNLSRAGFIQQVERAQQYIRSGDIYQVNLSHRLAAKWPSSGWDLFQKLSAVSPAPFSAYLDCDDFQVVSSSPELFLRLSGSHIQTRPIKGTRPRSSDPNRDTRLAYELQTSPKEMAELVMITDLLRNDLGKVCEFGAVQVPDPVRLERYPQVQHLVSTVEGRLRPGVSHLAAFASCFPGGSITGAPKFRAMQIIDELEPVTRGPYTGALGYLGFNRESQLSIIIRTGICKAHTAYFHAGAGIVADSIPAAEYDETIAKAGGFLGALQLQQQTGAVWPSATKERP